MPAPGKRFPKTADRSEPTQSDGAITFSPSLPLVEGSVKGLVLPEACANRIRSSSRQILLMLARDPTTSSSHVVFRTSEDEVIFIPFMHERALYLLHVGCI